jgi:uncharacterized membrane protein YgdD (TMEM256/DUF423 family)
MALTWFRIGAAICFLAVALGAFGAHALKQTLEAHHSRDVWSTAVLYQFLHGLALLVLAHQTGNRAACYLFLAGILLFSGSLYVLSLTGVNWLGALTPLGGFAFLAGWAWLFFAPR